MESGKRLHVCPWNRDIYIYTGSRQLRDSGFFKHYDRWHGHTNFSSYSKCILPEFHSAGTAAGIGGRNNWNMESGKHQYICSWNCDIFIYTNSGQLLYTGFYKYYNR